MFAPSPARLAQSLTEHAPSSRPAGSRSSDVLRALPPASPTPRAWPSTELGGMTPRARARARFTPARVRARLTSARVPLTMVTSAAALLLASTRGYDKGYDKGYGKGTAAGYSEGFSKGWDKGHEKGHEIGYGKGAAAPRTPRTPPGRAILRSRSRRSK